MGHGCFNMATIYEGNKFCAIACLNLIVWSKALYGLDVNHVMVKSSLSSAEMQGILPFKWR